MLRFACACAGLVLVLGSAALTAADQSPLELVEHGHWKHARTVLESRIRTNPRDPEAAYLLSRVRLAFGDFDGAVQLAEQAVKLDPRNADYHFQLSRASGELGRRASVFKQIALGRRVKSEAEAALALNPAHIDARMLLIVFFVNAPGIIGGDRKRAEQMVDEIARINPSAGFMARASLASELNQDDQLEGWYQKAIEADPSNFDARAGLLNVYLSRGQKTLDLAETQARELLKLDSTQVAPYTALAIVYASIERMGDLEKLLGAAERTVPDDLAPDYEAGRILATRGSHLDAAERYLRKYLSAEPEAGASTLADAHWRLATVFEKQGRKREAVTELETAIRMNPDLEEAKKDLKRLRTTAPKTSSEPPEPRWR